MEFEMPPYIVYAKTNSGGYITAVNSSAFLTDTTEWVEIDSGYGDRYHHAQGNYLPKPIITEAGVYRYKLVGGRVTECSASEILEQEAAARMAELPIAPRNIIEGEYITVGGVLYKATDNIPAGERIITGQNATETTYEEQLYELTRGE